MPTTLRRLLEARRFRLELVGAETAALDVPLLWAHSSDLPDPTPWLAPQGLLLTDGVQFLPAQDTDPDPYVTRLREAGITALGFAVQTVHPAMPPGLVTECTRQGMPLVRVAADTPFMAIIRAVADAIADDERNALESALTAQRSVARAALRPDGLAAILRELENHLHTWVMLYDAAGEKVGPPSGRAVPAETEAMVADEVRRILQRGRPVGARIPVSAGNEATLQSIGRRGRLRGVLAVGVHPQAARTDTDLLESVVALASIGLEQSRTWDEARRALRTGILEMFAVGATGAGEKVLRRFAGAAPLPPFRLVGISLTHDPDARATALATLEVLGDRSRGRIFFGERGEEIWVALADEDLPALREVLDGTGLFAGASGPTDWSGWASGVDEARAARPRATPGERLALFDDRAQEGYLDTLQQAGAGAAARARLARLDAAPDAAATIEQLDAWLDHNGAWEPAARALGMHRHTLKARVEDAARILDLDLEGFAGRAELWTLLRLARARATSP